nr:unnamed protein product [Spirometra erinaceieuropaei]
MVESPLPLLIGRSRDSNFPSFLVGERSDRKVSRTRKDTVERKGAPDLCTFVCRIKLQTKTTLYPAEPQYNLSWLERDPSEVSPKASCRQTSQSAAWIVDEEGFYCLRADVLPSGCCNRTSNSTEPSRYSCFSCSRQDCCSAYERCVACCLNPVNVSGVAINSPMPDPSRNQSQICRIKLQTKTTLYPAEPQYNLSWLERDPSEVSPKASCRQTSQSAAWIVDEEGFYCPRADVLPSGCCNRTSNSTEPSRYSCFSCSRQDCCSAYERCVACCLNPVNRNHWRMTMEAAQEADDRNLLIATSVFEFCSFRCRTSSEVCFLRFLLLSLVSFGCRTSSSSSSASSSSSPSSFFLLGVVDPAKPVTAAIFFTRLPEVLELDTQTRLYHVFRLCPTSPPFTNFREPS